MIATLEKDSLTAKVSRDILDNLNFNRYAVMKRGEALDLFSGDEKWQRVVPGHQCARGSVSSFILGRQQHYHYKYKYNASVIYYFINIQRN